MVKSISHVVKRPGRVFGDPDVEIPVAEDLTTTPGIPLREADVSFFSRVDPLETQNIEKGADRDWVWSVYSPEVADYMRGHDERMKPLVDSAEVSANVKLSGAPREREDLTEDIRRAARELGFGEVGFTRFDRRYLFECKRSWAKFPHAICLAMEQDYDQTQSIPSLEAEHAHFDTYEFESKRGDRLADLIREMGYHAQIHSPRDPISVMIPMFVAAGLGQLGANGQLLSPHFGSRARLMMITTDAPVTYDKPVDYGIHAFCQKCLICVERCPARALVREKVWWRGAEKNKVIYERCRPVMAIYDGCGICMKVCPIQKFGMPAVMNHYVQTGEVLGKGTHELEGYSLHDKGYFGPGRLPNFERSLFDIPHGRREDWLFEQFKERLAGDDIPADGELTEFARNVKSAIDKNGITRDT
ncbi:MAG: hypothetical protein OXG46_10030 [Chloroflexi bacterium]|nr:hypothetical protein [Chloroflexota bacterium]MCY3937354.1 hypothetical protein [Chloroflexota bacterium]